MAKYSKNFFITDKTEDILFFLEYNSKILFDKIKELNEKERFFLLRKYLTHSDLATRGKHAKKEKEVQNFILYYDSAEELKNYGKLPTAAQSCIGLSEEFYKITEIKSYASAGNLQHQITDWNILTPSDANKDYNFEDFDKIRILNQKNSYSDNFSNYLKKFDKRNYIYKHDYSYLEFDSLTIAAHGLGTDENKLLTYFRSMTFKADVFNILIDKKERVLYLFFERNEKYYQLLNKVSDTLRKPPIWDDYTEEDKKTVTHMLYSLSVSRSDFNNEKTESVIDDNFDVSHILEVYYKEYNRKIQDIIKSGEKPKYRWYQKKWKEVLIKLDEATFNEKGFAVCAISGLKGNYDKLGKFFIASHIKPYSKCIAEEDYESAFDPHNGFILSANIDALFDQYLITIRQNGKIIMNNAVKTIDRLKQMLPNNKIDSEYLTTQRKIYLKFHEAEFDKKSR